MASWLRYVLLWAIATLCCAALAQTLASPPSKPKNLRVLPKDLTTAQVVDRMRIISDSLGVKCSFCHVPGGFDKDDMDSKQIARRMLRMVDAINHDNFSDRPEVTCYTCHRGQQRPVSQVPAGQGR